MKQCYTLTGLDVLGKIRSYIRLLTVILLYVTFALPASAQGGGKAVSGIVKDDTGNPLIGVTVTVPGTTKGTTTDANGTYTINADNSESLNFSYVGYKPQTIHVNNQSTIDVTMSEDNTSLEEVVVVGYGVQKRRDIVGAVETLSTKGLEERMGSSMSISRSLQGAIPGLTMTFSDGKPNRGATVRIRGAENSIGSGGSALVMVDGVETDMSTVNPDDIESITVLKDASPYHQKASERQRQGDLQRHLYLLQARHQTRDGHQRLRLYHLVPGILRQRIRQGSLEHQQRIQILAHLVQRTGTPQQRPLV